jgi:hypothetical protein
MWSPYQQQIPSIEFNADKNGQMCARVIVNLSRTSARITGKARNGGGRDKVPKQQTGISTNMHDWDCLAQTTEKAHSKKGNKSVDCIAL